MKLQKDFAPDIDCSGNRQFSWICLWFELGCYSEWKHKF